MTRNKTGGAAFPLESDYGSQPGMTLRDYFAGQADWACSCEGQARKRKHRVP